MALGFFSPACIRIEMGDKQIDIVGVLTSLLRSFLSLLTKPLVLWRSIRSTRQNLTLISDNPRMFDGQVWRNADMVGSRRDKSYWIRIKALLF